MATVASIHQGSPCLVSARDNTHLTLGSKAELLVDQQRGRAACAELWTN